MRYFRVIVLVLFLCSVGAFAQENNSRHTIEKGETISSIAQKYKVSIAAIYKLNPKAKKTLQLNQVLLIPNTELKKENISESAAAEPAAEINHEVLPKETLYGITKQFKTTKELLYKANPNLETEGLKIGQTIVIPSALTKKELAGLSNTKPQEIVETAKPLTHQVRAKESLYSIARQYGITLKELQAANSDIGKRGLSIGQIIAIPNNGKLAENEAVGVNANVNQKEAPITDTNPALTAVNTQVSKGKELALNEGTKLTVPVVAEGNAKETKTDSEIAASEVVHEVLPKETKYGIAKKYGITVAVLEKQNPGIRQKLVVGEKLSIQVPNNAIDSQIKNEDAVASQTQKQLDTTAARVTIANEDLINQLIQEASDKIGTRYRSGGTTAAGFDCSGFMCSTFGAFDIKLPRSSIEQSSIGEKVDDVNVQKGDLIFFKTNGRSRINHVGMVVEVADDEIKFIHSSTHSGVIISSTKEPYYHRNFAQVNRVLK